MPSSTTKKYGISAETRKCRRRIATRWKKMTDIAFSSAVNASALKNTSVTSSTPPITCRCSTKLRSSSTSASERPGSDEREVVAEHAEQPLRLERVRQHDHDEDEQRHERQQRVVRHRAGEEQPLVRPESLEDAEREGAGVREDSAGSRAQRSRGRIHRRRMVVQPRQASTT